MNKKKNPDKALIIREEQGYVDKEVFDFEFVFIEIKGFFGNAELDPSMLGLGIFLTK